MKHVTEHILEIYNYGQHFSLDTKVKSFSSWQLVWGVIAGGRWRGCSTIQDPVIGRRRYSPFPLRFCRLHHSHGPIRQPHRKLVWLMRMRGHDKRVHSLASVRITLALANMVRLETMHTERIVLTRLFSQSPESQLISQYSLTNVIPITFFHKIGSDQCHTS